MSQKAKDRLIFWIRLIGWLVVGCAVPIIIFAVKFGLFDDSGYNVTTDSLGNVVNVRPTALSGWGILACIIIFWTILQVLKEIRKAYVGYSFTKQCIDGVVKTIIPLVAIIVGCFILKNALANVTYCLIVLTICKLIAIPLNPLPKWRYEKSGQEDYSDALAYVVKFIKDKAKGGKE